MNVSVGDCNSKKWITVEIPDEKETLKKEVYEKNV